MVRNNNNSVNPEDVENVQNYRWNQATQTNGICRNGLFKPETKTVTTVEQLTDEINSYQAGTYTIYKIIGPMSNSEYNQIQNLINNKSNNLWNDEYVGLDLSEVAELTRIDYTWGLMKLILPSYVMEFGEYAQFRKVKILDDNPNFIYENGVLYSKDKTSLYFYPTEKTETSFVIPSTVKNIWSASFCWNNNIKNITIPKSAIFIGMAAFQTNSIESLTFKDKQNWFISNTSNPVNSSDLENPSNYRWNQQLQQNGILRDGVYKSE